MKPRFSLFVLAGVAALFFASAVVAGEQPPEINWDSDVLSLDRATRSLRFTVDGPATATGTPGQSAIKVTMVDLDHPVPANPPGFPNRNFSTFDTRVNGACIGGSHNGHHCDVDADCRVCTSGPIATLFRPCTSNADCGGVSGSCPAAGGTCSNLAACTNADEQNGCARWVGEPHTFLESQDLPALGNYRAARLQCTPFYFDWVAETKGGPITVVGGEIVPSSTYSVQAYAASCKGSEDSCTNVSSAVEMLTRLYGDLAKIFEPPGSYQPDGSDIVQLVNKFKSQPGAPIKAIALIQPNLPELNGDVSGSDIVDCIKALKQNQYRFGGPCPCPSLAACGALACPSGATMCINSTLPGLGAEATCIKTCSGGVNDGDPCINNSHCPGGGTCGNPFCRDRCGRCSP